MTDITVTRGADVDGFLSRFEVTVAGSGSSARYEVTLSSADFARLGANHRSPEDFVRACFAFLLEREPKESILPSFDVSVIGRYFPEFERVISGR